MRFPSAYPPTTERRYEPSTAIQQYSAGRSHVMGLADSGRIWVWHDMGRPAIFIKPLHVDLMENVSLSSKGRATKVIGGKLYRVCPDVLLITWYRMGQMLDIR